MSKQSELVTVIYYCEKSVELFRHVGRFCFKENGRIEFPLEFKQGKSIVAVCRGDIDIMNKVGDRILPTD